MLRSAVVETRRDGRPAVTRFRESGPPLQVAVVATTERGTRAALVAARDFGSGLQPDVTLMILRFVPHLQPMHYELSGAVRSLEQYYCHMAEECGVDAKARVCVCRPDNAGLAQAVAG